MAERAHAIDRLREELYDPTVRKNDFWLRRAKREVEQALDREVITEATFHDLMGAIYGHLKDREAELAHHQRALRLEPSNRAFAHNLAVALVNHGRHDDGITILERIDDPEHANVLVCMLLTTALVEVGDWAGARRALRRAFAAADLEAPTHLWGLARAAAIAGKYDLAVETFARLLALRAGSEVGEALSDPLRYVLDHGREHMESLPPVHDALVDAMRRVAELRGIGVERPSASDHEDEADAVEVLRAFADLRARANHAVMGDGT